MVVAATATEALTKKV